MPSTGKSKGTFGDRTTNRPAKEGEQEMEFCYCSAPLVGPMAMKEFCNVSLIRTSKSMPTLKDYFDDILHGKDVKESNMYDQVVSATIEWLSSLE